MLVNTEIEDKADTYSSFVTVFTFDDMLLTLGGDVNLRPTNITGNFTDGTTG